ncbi:MAG: aminopeptidase P N-terminal domain-containing protein [Burkholderiales bacterium]
MFDAGIYRRRRVELAKRMRRGVAIVSTAAQAVRNGDSHYPFRFDSYFYYLTGFAEPGAVLAVLAEGAQSILFCRPKDPQREIWDGFRYGPESAREILGFDRAYGIDKLDAMAPELLADQPVVHYAVGADKQWDERVLSWLNAVRERVRSGVGAPNEVRDLRVLLDEMRLKKGAHEINTMRRAASITAGAHRRAMQKTRPGVTEYQIEAELIHEFRRHGAQAPAYTPIVAGGVNSCVLHYVANNSPLRAGDLLLIDAGCELDGYASDVTRTFPVNGRFSAAQRDVYQMVLEAQRAAITRVKPGNHWEQPHQAALKVLVRGMIDLGLCKGSVDAVLESGDYRRFYMHRTGHWLGMDVHDVGAYKQNGKWRKLEPGMTLTVEPGCYIRPGKGVPRRLWNIGVRIEDDVLVTRDGHEILSAAAPKTVDEIETCMRVGSDAAGPG